MQPRQPSAVPPQDPLLGFSHEHVVQAKPLARPLSGPGAAPLHRAEPIRLVPEIRMYHRLLRGKLHPLTVKLRPERAQGLVAGTDSSSLTGGPLVSIQPVIPGATVSPASIDVPAANGGEAKFWVMPVGRRGMKLRDCRIEFRSGGRLVEAVRAPTRVVTRRAAWFFLCLAIAVPALFAWMRANPVREFRPSLRPPAGQGNVRPVAPPGAPAPQSTTDQKNETKGADGERKSNPGASPAAPSDPKADAKGKETGAEKQSSPAAGETKAPAPPRPAAGSQPARQGQPGGTPPRRAGGGAVMAQASPEAEAAALTPLEPRDSLDKYLITRIYPYVKPKPSASPDLAVNAKSVEFARWPDDARGFFYLGLFYIKDGYSLSEEKNFPGLLDVYEFIMSNDWLPYQDFVIGGILLFISILLWFMQGAASRRLKAGVLEIVPA